MKTKGHTKLWEWQQRAKAGGIICKCGEIRHITVDHIVPEFLLRQLTAIDEDVFNLEINFEFLCRYCNHQKMGRLDMRNPKTYEVLQHIMLKSKEYFLPK